MMAVLSPALRRMPLAVVAVLLQAVLQRLRGILGERAQALTTTLRVHGWIVFMGRVVFPKGRSLESSTSPAYSVSLQQCLRSRCDH